MNQRKKIYLTLICVFVAVFLFTFLTQKFKDNNTAEAANAWNYDAGYIISDWQMTDYNSMNEAEIQAFLQSKNPCNNTDRASYDYNMEHYPKYPHSWKDGHFVCIWQEKFGDGTVVGSGESAAHIIWQAAQDYRINPKVLIVMLEKEQGLVTDTMPNHVQYMAAMGYGCPDTDTCNPKYAGLKNQVRSAANHFRTFLDGYGYTNYPVGNVYVQYNPNSACGGSVVNIRNVSTSALYTYTPYQPNASALNAGYGYGDGCGAYGNRNFYLFFEDWFGGITRSVDPYEEAQTSYQRPVEDGVYRLVPKVNTNKAADIYGGAFKEARMQTYARKTSGYENQVFEVKYNSDGYYNIINPTTGSAFDVRGAVTNNETAIDVYPYHSNCNQDWLFEQNSDGYYTIKSRCSSRVIDVKSDTQELIIYDDHKGDNQKWKLERVDNTEIISGKYRFVSKMYPSEVIDIEGGAFREAPLISYVKKGSGFDNQMFEVRYGSDGYYNIINPTTGSAIDVNDGEKNLGNLTPVGVWPFHSKCNQDFELIKDDSGYYKFKSRCSGRVLDIVSDSKKLIIYDDHNGDNQKWRLERVY